MVDVAVTFPEPHPDDDEDVVWGLSTSSALWARGERGDAVVWLRRAVEAAVAAGQEQRAAELRGALGELEQAMEEHVQQTMPRPPKAPQGVADALPDQQQSAGIEVDVDPASAPPATAPEPQPAPAPAKTPSAPPKAASITPAAFTAPAIKQSPSVPPPPPPRGPLPSYTFVGMRPSPRAPILDPWADEQTLPSIKVDPVMRAQIAGDEVMVQMRRPAQARGVVVDEDEDVVTSAAPLDVTLRHASRPPLLRKAPTSDQPGHIADAPVPSKVSVKPPPPPPPARPPAAPAETAKAPSAPPAAARAPAAASEGGKAPSGPPATARAPAAATEGGKAPSGPPATARAPAAASEGGKAPSGPPAAPASAAAPSVAAPATASSPGAASPPAASTIPRPPPAPRAASVAPPPASPVESPTLPSMPSPLARPRTVAPPPAAPTVPVVPAAPSIPRIPGPASVAPPAPGKTLSIPSVRQPLSSSRPSSPSVRPPPSMSPSVRPPAPSTSVRPPAPRVAPPSSGSSPRAPAPPKVAGAPISLEGVKAFTGVDAEARAQIAAKARVESLAADEEVSGFAAALVLEGAASVCPAIADTPVAQATPGSLITTRGSSGEPASLRIVAGAAGAKVAVWEGALVDGALSPEVREELTAAADRLHALAGAAVGPLNELDDDDRARLFDKLRARVVRPREVITAAGADLVELMLVCAGAVEVIDDEDGALLVRPGELLFAREMQAGSKCPATACAAAAGALLLVGDRALAADFAAVPAFGSVLSR